MLNKYLFKFNESYISLYSDLEKIFNKLSNDSKSILKTIPCEIIYQGNVSEITENSNYITVLNSQKRTINVDKNKNIINMTSTNEEFRFPDLTYAILGMLSNVLAKEDIFLLHSAAVTNEEKKSILIMGDPGSGKSTLAFHLIKNNNYKLLSNDITAIKKVDNQIKILGGTTHMQMRLGAIKLYYPEIINSIEKKNSNGNEWDTKLFVNNVLTDKNIYTDNDTTVNNIFHVTTASNLDFSIREDEFVDNYLYIYEQLIRQIRNTRNLIVGYDYPLESFESNETNKKVAELAKFIAQNINVFDTRGNIKEVAKEMVYRNEK